MKRYPIPILLIFLLLLAVSLALFHPQVTGALPEYSAQTGEPCATCHLSPSGGGPRGLRGQAWVGSGKPGAVPTVAEALSLLGIHLEVDERQFQSSGRPVPQPQPLQVRPVRAERMHNHLKNYGGN